MSNEGQNSTAPEADGPWSVKYENVLVVCMKNREFWSQADNGGQSSKTHKKALKQLRRKARRLQREMEEQKLAPSALSEFQNQNYTNCLTTLGQLLAQRPTDLKIQHNKAVLEFYISGHSNVEAFQKSISSLCNAYKINIDESEAPDDVEICILYYNQSLIHFVQKNYEMALEVLEKIISLIQPMEELLAHRVSRLYIELNLHESKIDKTLGLIDLVENQFISKTNDEANLGKLMDKDEKTDSFDNATDNLKIDLFHYRAKCYLLNRELDLAQKELEKVYAAQKQNFTTVMIRSQVELLKHNYQKAEEILRAIQENVPAFCALSEEQLFIYFNNMGSLLHYKGKPGMSKYYLSCKGSNMCVKALTKIAQRDSIRPRVFQPASIAHFKYNVGIALLFAERPAKAFDCFTEASQIMHMSPLVWLRLAECCIHVHNSGNEDVFDFQMKRKELVVGAVGSGSSYKIILNDKLYKNMAYSSEPQSYAIPAPNLDFATLCIRNAKRLLPRKSIKLKMAVYTASAYINLTIGNPLEALRDTKVIMDDDNASDLYKFLGRMYMAEAYLMLDKIHEATDVLNPALYADCDPSQEKLFSRWYPTSKISAHTALQYNLAVVLATRGELEKSADILKRIWVARGPKSDVPIHVISLAIYIELVLGHFDIARTIIRQNCPHVFPTSGH